MIQEEFENIVEKLLVHSEQTNVELAEILEETNNALEDTATKLLKEVNKEVTKSEVELEIVNEENEVLKQKLQDANEAFVEMKNQYKKEKAANMKNNNQKEGKFGY